MTPTEKKAIEIYKRFHEIKNLNNYEAKQCFVICVDEIIKSRPSLPILLDNGSLGNDIELSTEFWQEVKQHIENL